MGRRQHSERYIDLIMEDGQERTARQVLDAIMNKWFDNLFSWLSKCEQTFGFENLQGYDTQRLYAYLAERYLSYWFKKYTKYKTWPWITLDKID